MTSSTFTLEPTGLDLRFRRVRLVSREWLTPHYVRVRLGGTDLEGFTSPGADDHLRIFFPQGVADSIEELRASPSREYTPVAWGEGWLDLEFAVHGDEGIAAVWAATAPLGAEAGIGGPRGSKVIIGTPNSWFLAGDETALPAIRRFVMQMDAGATGRIIVEVIAAEDEQPVVAPSGVHVAFVHRGESPAGSVLAHTLESLGAADRPRGSVFGFVAAEQSVVKPGRALLLQRWNLSPDQIIVKGYWKRGEAEYHAPH